MPPSFASLFGGFRGVDIGAQAAGFELAWSLEYDPQLAEIGAQLPGRVHVMNILDADPADFERVDVLHNSAPCVRASVANSGGELNEDGLRESPLDIALANKVIEFVDALRPTVFTLENVIGYRKFQAWQGGKKCEGIYQALTRLGYWVDMAHVNSADFGVPQTRKRMIVRAVQGRMVPYLPAHESWVGWYQAIEDLIPSLPESKFAPWQLERLPGELREFMVTGQHGAPNGVENRACQVREKAEPSNTVTSSNHGDWRAFLVDGQNGTQSHGTPTIRSSDEPSFTVANQGKGKSRAWLAQGRVVAMTPRALARFQSFPDWYQLSGKNPLDCKGIGNACPPLEFEKIYKGLKGIL